MDVIQTARQLGKAVQEDKRYIAMRLAQERSDQDAELQDMIKNFNQSRLELNFELQKPERDQEKIKELDSGIKAMYAKIFENDNMLNFNKARDELQSLMDFVNQILTGSADGRNPDLIEYEESCGGNCGGCAGCN